MARPLRIECPGATWHITSRGNDRENIVRSDADREHFMELLGEAARRYRWVVLSYSLMSNHYHLVIETPEPTLSRGMQWLNGRYAQAFNRRHGRVGHVFQGRFKGMLVDKDTYLLQLLRYVVLNPVRAKMVERPEQHAWSSYRAIAGYEDPPPWLAVDRVLSLFGTDRAKAQSDYRDVINGCTGDPWSPRDAVIGQIYLGSSSWIDEVKRRIDSVDDTQPEVERPAMTSIISAVAKTCGVGEDHVRDRRGGRERMVAAWLGCFEGVLTMRSIAAGLRMRRIEPISELIRTCDRALKGDPALRVVVDECCKELQRPSVRPAAFD